MTFDAASLTASTRSASTSGITSSGASHRRTSRRIWVSAPAGPTRPDARTPRCPGCFTARPLIPQSVPVGFTERSPRPARGPGPEPTVTRRARVAASVAPGPPAQASRERDTMTTTAGRRPAAARPPEWSHGTGDRITDAHASRHSPQQPSETRSTPGRGPHAHPRHPSSSGPTAGAGLRPGRRGCRSVDTRPGVHARRWFRQRRLRAGRVSAGHGDEPSGDLAQLEVAGLGDLPQHAERLIGRAAPLYHDDAQRLVDDRPPGKRRLQIVGQLGASGHLERDGHPTGGAVGETLAPGPARPG